MAEKSFVNCTGGGPIRVHVEDGKITKVRPLVFDETDAPSWTIEADGKKYSPPRKACVAPFTLTERARVYSDDRIMYPDEARGLRPQGRPGSTGPAGVTRRTGANRRTSASAGTRPSTSSPSEMMRIRETYGPEAITSRASSHHNWGNVGYRTGAWARFFNLLGFTDILDNPDSWEGWHWGATHTYGFYWRLGNPEHYDMLEDALKNTELIIYWGNDPDTTHGIYGGKESAQWRLWLKEQGVKPDLHRPLLQLHRRARGRQVDRLPARHRRRPWRRPSPTCGSPRAPTTTSTSRPHARASTSSRRTSWARPTACPRRPQWAAEISDVPARTIMALAREWASNRTMLAGGTKGGEGGSCRQAYATE